MKQFKISLCVFLLFVSLVVQGGGIITNTNQSASWARMYARNASLDLDAVFYNPAGLTAFGKGLYFSLNNQLLFSNRTVKNNYSYLNSNEYTGKVVAPIYPSIYGAYSTGRLVFSFGFNIVGGGGSAIYDKGLPSFELGLSDLVPSLSTAPSNVSAYSADIRVKGSLINLGYQFGVSYKVNEMLSVFGGVRYVTVKNLYTGYLQDINVTSNGTTMPASNLLSGIADQMNNMMAIPANLQPLVTAGGGSLTLAQAQGTGYLPVANRTSIEQALAYIGVPSAAIGVMNINQIQGAFTFATPSLQANYTNASIKAKLLRNQEAYVVQKGTGFCPIIGVNITPNKKLNIGIKFEFGTKMEVTNKTTKDFVVDSIPGKATTKFPEGLRTPADMPALLTIGTSYKLSNKIKISGSVLYYFDKNVNYGHLNSTGDVVSNNQLIDKNNYELALGFEYNVTPKFLMSTGYLYTSTGVKDQFNTDISFCLGSHSFGFGVKYEISQKIDVELGVSYTDNIPSSKIYNHIIKTNPSQDIIVKEKYYKNTLICAIGFNVKLSKI